MSPTTGLVHRPRATDEFFFEEGCHILETWNRADDPAVSIARARVEPGTTTRLHRLAGIVERYLILSGQGRVELEGVPPRAVVPGDLVYIPAEQGQRITNTGESDLVFLAVCTPRFVRDAYEDIDPEAPV
jgi:mannose-6-phosphate isomerase-like protein (cupin superfamily)